MASLPNTYKRLTVMKLTENFREAVSVETAEMCSPQKRAVCIRNKFVGINAGDVNVAVGQFGGKTPFGVGFEGLGEIVAIGEGVEHISIGQSVAYMNTNINSHSEYVCISVDQVYAIPELKPEYVALLVGGMAATLGLDKCARVTAGETVLITASAGGVGHIAVQWAKIAGCHVIGTCSSEEKEKILKDLGCDRVINYKTEDLGEVLAKEYKKGIDVVWETIGGNVLETCLKNLATKGRLIIASGISNNKVDLSFLPELLMSKFATVQGFRRGGYRDCFSTYFKFLLESFESGKIKTITDNGVKSTGHEFFGLEGIIQGVEHLYTGKSIGKIVVRLF